ncbi:uncharacterized protein CLUP02_01759 [Colletotrichum lupini]|uniref:Uncharacterized protein n=1 Tax=Colletotrichum lupini TaxID=145971 RepID=A0A9Q8SCZ4_9PEZI|nr:uncharacterized protein CLUP02_01759 [Colletotrichum lupini]UQC75106.1 hypothetical protein CLUP02_01759 [Colletotrichum lupini]
MGHYRRSVALEEHLNTEGPRSREDTLSLARVNGRFYDICAELLYRRIIVTDGKGFINSRKLQTTLTSSGAELQKRVMQLRIGYDHDYDMRLTLRRRRRLRRRYPRPLAHWFSAIPKLPGLERLVLRCLSCVVYDFIEAGIPALPRVTDLCLYGCEFSTGSFCTQEDFFLCFPALRTLTIGARWKTGLPNDAHAFAPFADTLETFTWYDMGASSPWPTRDLSILAYPLQARGLRVVKHLKVTSLLELMCGETDGCAAGKTVETIELLDGIFDLRHVPRLLTKDGRWNGLDESASPESSSSSLSSEETISEEMEMLLKFLFRQCRDVYRQVRVLDIRVIDDNDDAYRTDEERGFLRKLALDYVGIFKEELDVVLLQGLSG